MRNPKKQKRLFINSRGFSLLEVLLGISVFMIGMLGVTALNISSMKSNTFSGNLSEATVIAAAKLEELMVQDFDDAAFLSDVDDDGSRLTDQDVDDDGLDDDDPDDAATDVDGKPNFGLDDVGAADADYNETVTKNNITYNVYWNVAENEPVTVDPQRTKRITVIVEWFVKEEPRRISMSTIRQKE
jgi:Tfp pilus assembly protein PilW